MNTGKQTADALTETPLHLERSTLEGKNKILGVWLFIGAETVLFACLFGTYLALRGQTMGGPTSQELFSLPLIAVATFILLTSSLTSVLGVVSMHQNDLRGLQLWFGITLLLGASFLGLEIYEFIHYTSLGHRFTQSAFASSFYTLTGTHGAHVLFGLCWILGLLIQSRKRGITKETAPRFYVASLYWHFIDVIWVFIFTVVYLMGAAG